VCVDGRPLAGNECVWAVDGVIGTALTVEVYVARDGREEMVRCNVRKEMRLWEVEWQIKERCTLDEREREFFLVNAEARSQQSKETLAWSPAFVRGKLVLADAPPRGGRPGPAAGERGRPAVRPLPLDRNPLNQNMERQPPAGDARNRPALAPLPNEAQYERERPAQPQYGGDARNRPQLAPFANDAQDERDRPAQPQYGGDARNRPALAPVPNEAPYERERPAQPPYGGDVRNRPPLAPVVNEAQYERDRQAWNGGGAGGGALFDRPAKYAGERPIEVVRHLPGPNTRPAKEYVFVDSGTDMEYRVRVTDGQTVGDVRRLVAESVGSKPEDVTLLLMGKALRDRFVFARLRIGADGVVFHVKKKREKPLMSTPFEDLEFT
jgi:hypothetical protein